MNLGFNDLWPTTVLISEVTQRKLLDDITSDILENHIYKPSYDLQNLDLINDGGELFEQFKKSVIEPIFDQYLQKVFNIKLDQCHDSFFKSWLAGPNSGYSIGAHNHSGASVSAVFYLLCEEQNQGGELVLMDPRMNANRGYPTPMKTPFQDQWYSPKTGEVAVFPSFLYHHAMLFRGKLRIAMPVDFFPGEIESL
jgi:hypothetical protein